MDFPALVWLNAEARYSPHPITEIQRSQMRYFADDHAAVLPPEAEALAEAVSEMDLCMY